MSQFLPPEWAPQSAVMLTWPHKASYWVDTLQAIEAVFTKTAAEIALRQKLIITCLDEQHILHVKTQLTKAHVDLTKVSLYMARSDDIWVRDHGPITVLSDNKPLLLDFTFTGWGYKYPAENDNRLTEHLKAQNAFGFTPIKKIDMALEGGGIEVDGQGTLLATRSCLLSKKRNPSMTQGQIESCLQSSLGVNRILWLDHGELEGDDTDGHIDTLARFCDPHTICYVCCTDKNDPHYDTFKAMEDELKSFTDYKGKPYRLVPLPFPSVHLADVDGRRLPVSYANFLIINDAILMPTYNDPFDDKALAAVAECFPDREMIAVPSLAVVQWYGSTHCMTMQLPRGVF